MRNVTTRLKKSYFRDHVFDPVRSERKAGELVHNQTQAPAPGRHTLPLLIDNKKKKKRKKIVEEHGEGKSVRGLADIKVLYCSHRTSFIFR